MRHESFLATKPERVRVPAFPPTTGFKIPRPASTMVCQKCGGTGKRANHKGHKPDCKCIACGPCKACGGRGRVEIEAYRKPEKSTEVDEVDRTLGPDDED